jgi:hypothetical protein
MFKFMTYVLANFREFPEMSKRRKIKFSVELFEKIDVYMNSYLENNKNKKYYFKILELFKSFVFVVLESNDTNYMKIPTDSRLLKVLQEFNQQQELEAMKKESKHSTRDKEKERVKDKDREKRKTRHRRARYEINEDVKNSEHSNDSVSETSDDTNKLVLDSDEVQSFFQMNA